MPSQSWKLTSQVAYQMPLQGSGVNTALHGPPYDNPWAMDLFGGTAVRVAVGGIVRKAGYFCGNGVRIEDSLGFNHLYCHGASATGLTVNQYVPAGTFIFNKGNSGTSTPHLHYEMMWRPPNVSSSGFNVTYGYVPYCATSVLYRVANGRAAVQSQRKATWGSAPNGAWVLGGNCDDAPY